MRSYAPFYYAENFMTGLRVVFDRENLVIGWKESDCKYILTYKVYNASICSEHWYHMLLYYSGYEAEDSSTLPVNRNQSAIPPTPAFGPSGYNPEATKQGGNTTQVTVLRPSTSHSSHPNSMKSIFLISIVLSLVFQWIFSSQAAFSTLPSFLIHML